MPVNSEHPEYKKNSKKWKRIRLVIEGEDAVKEAGEEFLPMLEGQEGQSGFGNNGNSYKAYKDRASFFAATARTVDGIEGAVFRKDPIVQFPESRKEFLETIGKEGTPFNTFTKKVFNNNLILGRHGVLLDMPANAAANVAPYFSSYNAESIINWRTGKVNGKEQLVMVVLRELTMVPDPKDSYSLITKEQIRVLRLGNLEGDGAALYYFVEVHEKQEGASKEGYSLIETIVPTIRGKKIEYIPFVFFGPKDLTVGVQKSPVADIVAINISHYRSSADLEHGRHFTALPTAWVAGFDTKAELKIGSTVAWVSEEPTATAGFLEFTGQGLGAIETALNDKEAQMAVIGARLLEEPKKAVESAETHIIRKGGEESVTASLAATTSAGFTQLLEWAAEWMGLTDKEIGCELNRDYSTIELSPQMLLALMQVLQSGNMSKDTWLYNLKRGELLPEGRTLEEELDLIDEHPPKPAAGNEMDLGDEEEEELDDEGNPIKKKSVKKEEK